MERTAVFNEGFGQLFISKLPYNHQSRLINLNIACKPFQDSLCFFVQAASSRSHLAFEMRGSTKYLCSPFPTPMKGFFLFAPNYSRIFDLAPYISLKTFGFATLLPVGITIDLPWVGV